MGWWEWFDQGQYLQSADAFSHFDFSPEKHFYPPLYPLLGAFFIRWWGNHPFWCIDLACLLWFSAVFVLFASRFIPRWSAIVLLVLSVLRDVIIFENFLIPWTSTLSAALLSTGIYGLLRVNDILQGRDHTVSRPTAFTIFCVSLAIGLLAPLRPADGIVGGVLWIGYLWGIRRVSKYEGAKQTPIFSHFVPAALGGISIGPALYLGYNHLVYGSAFGRYVKTAAANGFYPADLPEKFVSLFLDGYTLYLEPKSALIDHYPWLLLSLLGIIYVIIRGDWTLRVVATAVCVQFGVYLPYGDLLPTGLWRFLNIHYFKWTFPYMALFAWLFGTFLVNKWKSNKKEGVLLTGTVVAAIILLLSLRVHVDLKLIAIPSAFSFNTGNARSFPLPASSEKTDLIDVTGLQGSFTDAYFGEHKLWVDGRELMKYRDFRVLPAPWGIRVLFIRPIHAESVLFQPDARLIRSGHALMISSGTYRFILGIPKPFWDEENAVAPASYKIAETIDFSNRGSSGMYTQKGWLDPESWGRWTSGTKASLRLRLDPPQTKSMLLDLNFGAFVNEKHPMQKLDITVNGVSLGQHLFRLDQGEDKPHSVTFVLPADAVGVDGELKLLLNTPDAISPRKLKIGEDRRKLGVGVVSMRLTLVDK